MKPKHIFLYITILTLFLLITLGAAELYFRFFNPQPIRPAVYEIDPIYGLKMIPGWRGYLREPDYGIQPFQLNSLGFRDNERTIHKPDNVYRIIGLGDSFSWGAGVKQEDTFLKKLEGSLNNTSGNTRYEVFNWGVNAWGTAQEMLCLKKHIMK